LRSFVLFILCTAAVAGGASAQSNAVATSAARDGNGAHDQSVLKPVKDPWSKTQRPLDLSAAKQAIRESAEDGGEHSLGSFALTFRVNSSVLMRDFKDNAPTLDSLNLIFQNKELYSKLDYVVITAGTSPEGYAYTNEKLAQARALAMKSYIMWQFPWVNRDIIYTFSTGEDWEGLRREVENDLNVPGRSEVLSLLDSQKSTDAKKAGLRQIGRGRTYAYLARYILPGLRGGTTISLCEKPASELQPVAEPEKKVVVVERTVVVERIVTDTVYVDRIVEQQPVEVVVPVVIEKPTQIEEPVKAVVPVEPEQIEEPMVQEQIKKPLLALKTNLFFDLYTAVNVEAEVPIGKRWSLAGEWIFPWWLLEKKQIALQAGIATLEMRHWLGNRNTLQPLNGWFLGAHGGWGYYDLEWKKEGYQGELWYGGLSGGYAHSINKNGNLRLEYSLGLGYMYSDYTKYVPQKDGNGGWHLIRQKMAERNYFGPTRAKVSLMWMLNRSYNKRGGVQ
jgi:hypothetical protein